MKLIISQTCGDRRVMDSNGGAESSLRLAAMILKQLGATCVQARNVEDGVEVFDPLGPDDNRVVVVGMRLEGGEHTEPVSTGGIEN
jgi:hypothetical protein